MESPAQSLVRSSRSLLLRESPAGTRNRRRSTSASSLREQPGSGDETSFRRWAWTVADDVLSLRQEFEAFRGAKQDLEARQLVTPEPSFQVTAAEPSTPSGQAQRGRAPPASLEELRNDQHKLRQDQHRLRSCLESEHQELRRELAGLRGRLQASLAEKTRVADMDDGMAPTGNGTNDRLDEIEEALLRLHQDFLGQSELQRALEKEQHSLRRRQEEVQGEQQRSSLHLSRLEEGQDFLQSAVTELRRGESGERASMEGLAPLIQDLGERLDGVRLEMDAIQQRLEDLAQMPGGSTLCDSSAAACLAGAAMSQDLSGSVAGLSAEVATLESEAAACREQLQQFSEQHDAAIVQGVTKTGSEVAVHEKGLMAERTFPIQLDVHAFSELMSSSWRQDKEEISRISTMLQSEFQEASTVMGTELSSEISNLRDEQGELQVQIMHWRTEASLAAEDVAKMHDTFDEFSKLPLHFHGLEEQLAHERSEAASGKAVIAACNKVEASCQEELAAARQELRLLSLDAAESRLLLQEEFAELSSSVDKSRGESCSLHLATEHCQSTLRHQGFEQKEVVAEVTELAQTLQAQRAWAESFCQARLSEIRKEFADLAQVTGAHYDASSRAQGDARAEVKSELGRLTKSLNAVALSSEKAQEEEAAAVGQLTESFWAFEGRCHAVQGEVVACETEVEELAENMAMFHSMCGHFESWTQAVLEVQELGEWSQSAQGQLQRLQASVSQLTEERPPEGDWAVAQQQLVAAVDSARKEVDLICKEQLATVRRQMEAAQSEGSFRSPSPLRRAPSMDASPSSVKMPIAKEGLLLQAAAEELRSAEQSAASMAAQREAERAVQLRQRAARERLIDEALSGVQQDCGILRTDVEGLSKAVDELQREVVHMEHESHELGRSSHDEMSLSVEAMMQQAASRAEVVGLQEALKQWEGAAALAKQQQSSSLEGLQEALAEASAGFGQDLSREEEALRSLRVGWQEASATAASCQDGLQQQQGMWSKLEDAQAMLRDDLSVVAKEHIRLERVTRDEATACLDALAGVGKEVQEAASSAGDCQAGLQLQEELLQELSRRMAEAVLSSEESQDGLRRQEEAREELVLKVQAVAEDAQLQQRELGLLREAAESGRREGLERMQEAAAEAEERWKGLEVRAAAREDSGGLALEELQKARSDLEECKATLAGEIAIMADLRLRDREGSERSSRDLASVLEEQRQALAGFQQELQELSDLQQGIPEKAAAELFQCKEDLRQQQRLLASLEEAASNTAGVLRGLQGGSEEAAATSADCQVKLKEVREDLEHQEAATEKLAEEVMDLGSLREAVELGEEGQERLQEVTAQAQELLWKELRQVRERLHGSEVTIAQSIAATADKQAELRRSDMAEYEVLLGNLRRQQEQALFDFQGKFSAESSGLPASVQQQEEALQALQEDQEASGREMRELAEEAGTMAGELRLQRRALGSFREAAEVKSEEGQERLREVTAEAEERWRGLESLLGAADRDIEELQETQAKMGQDLSALVEEQSRQQEAVTASREWCHGLRDEVQAAAVTAVEYNAGLHLQEERQVLAASELGQCCAEQQRQRRALATLEETVASAAKEIDSLGASVKETTSAAADFRTNLEEVACRGQQHATGRAYEKLAEEVRAVAGGLQLQSLQLGALQEAELVREEAQGRLLREELGQLQKGIQTAKAALEENLGIFADDWLAVQRATRLELATNCDEWRSGLHREEEALQGMQESLAEEQRAFKSLEAAVADKGLLESVDAATAAATACRYGLQEQGQALQRLEHKFWEEAERKAADAAAVKSRQAGQEEALQQLRKELGVANSVAAECSDAGVQHEQVIQNLSACVEELGREFCEAAECCKADMRVRETAQLQLLATELPEAKAEISAFSKELSSLSIAQRHQVKQSALRFEALGAESITANSEIRELDDWAQAEVTVVARLAEAVDHLQELSCKEAVENCKERRYPLETPLRRPAAVESPGLWEVSRSSPSLQEDPRWERLCCKVEQVSSDLDAMRQDCSTAVLKRLQKQCFSSEEELQALREVWRATVTAWQENAQELRTDFQEEREAVRDIRELLEHSSQARPGDAELLRVASVQEEQTGQLSGLEAELKLLHFEARQSRNQCIRANAEVDQAFQDMEKQRQAGAQAQREMRSAVCRAEAELQDCWKEGLAARLRSERAVQELQEVQAAIPVLLALPQAGALETERDMAPMKEEVQSCEAGLLHLEEKVEVGHAALVEEMTAFSALADSRAPHRNFEAENSALAEEIAALAVQCSTLEQSVVSRAEDAALQDLVEELQSLRTECSELAATEKQAQPLDRPSEELTAEMEEGSMGPRETPLALIGSGQANTERTGPTSSTKGQRARSRMRPPQRRQEDARQSSATPSSSSRQPLRMRSQEHLAPGDRAAGQEAPETGQQQLQKVLLLHFPDAPWPVPSGFPAALRFALAAQGAGRSGSLQLEMRQRQGSVVAEVRGPREALDELQALTLQEMEVQGNRVGLMWWSWANDSSTPQQEATVDVVSSSDDRSMSDVDPFAEAPDLDEESVLVDGHQPSPDNMLSKKHWEAPGQEADGRSVLGTLEKDETCREELAALRKDNIAQRYQAEQWRGEFQEQEEKLARGLAALSSEHHAELASQQKGGALQERKLEQALLSLQEEQRQSATAWAAQHRGLMEKQDAASQEVRSLRMDCSQQFQHAAAELQLAASELSSQQEDGLLQRQELRQLSAELRRAGPPAADTGFGPVRGAMNVLTGQVAEIRQAWQDSHAALQAKVQGALEESRGHLHTELQELRKSSEARLKTALTEAREDSRACLKAAVQQAQKAREECSATRALVRDAGRERVEASGMNEAAGSYLSMYEEMQSRLERLQEDITQELSHIRDATAAKLDESVRASDLEVLQGQLAEAVGDGVELRRQVLAICSQQLDQKEEDSCWQHVEALRSRLERAEALHWGAVGEVRTRCAEVLEGLSFLQGEVDKLSAKVDAGEQNASRGFALLQQAVERLQAERGRGVRQR